MTAVLGLRAMGEEAADGRETEGMSRRPWEAADSIMTEGF